MITEILDCSEGNSSRLCRFFSKELVRTFREVCPILPLGWPCSSLLILPVALYWSVRCVKSDTLQRLEELLVESDSSLQELVLGREATVPAARCSLMPLLAHSWTGGEGEELQVDSWESEFLVLVLQAVTQGLLSFNVATVLSACCALAMQHLVTLVLNQEIRRRSDQFLFLYSSEVKTAKTKYIHNIKTWLSFKLPEIAIA